MHRRVLWFIGITIGLGHALDASAASLAWTAARGMFDGTPFVSVAASAAQPARVMAATTRAVYESTDGGEHWQERFRLPANTTAATLAISTAPDAAILLGTDQGLYGSFDGGAHWQRIFRGIGEDERACFSVAFAPAQPATALLGTGGGLFISRDSGRTWQPAGPAPGARAILHIAPDPHDADRVFVATGRGVSVGRLASGQWQERLITMRAEEQAVEESDVDKTDGETDLLHHLSAVAADPDVPDTIYAGSARGVARSRDAGATWEWLTHSGLVSTLTGRLIPMHHSPLMLYAATDQGVARYDLGQERWEMLMAGLSVARVNDLAVSAGRLWAATAQGLYSAPLDPAAFEASEPPSARDLLGNFVHEPTVRQVQEAAIRYGDVHPDKIARWRRRAALQALLPSFNMGWDRDHAIDTRIDEGSFPNFQVLNTEDRDEGFDASITWDLGELIWNDDQTSIDVRSKLMVQLRDDLVTEVTRAYFERRRLQLLLLTQPPSDAQAALEKELRIAELTALIDGLTGGDFSTHVGLDTHH